MPSLSSSLKWVSLLLAKKKARRVAPRRRLQPRVARPTVAAATAPLGEREPRRWPQAVGEGGCF